MRAPMRRKRTATEPLSKSSNSPLSAAEQFEHKVFRQSTFKLNALLLFLGVLLPLLAFEGIYRLAFEPLGSASKWTDRPDMFYMPESSLENRDAYYPREKPVGAFRIVAVGDSFTFAGKGEWDDSYVKRLERILNLNERQRKVEVLNWGVPGYATWQEQDFVRRAVELYNADLVLLQITLNDPELMPYKATGAYKEQQADLARLQHSFIRHWHSLQFILTRLYNSKTERNYLRYYSDLFSNERTWSRFSGSLAGIRGISKSSNVPVVAVIFPLFSHPFNDSYPFTALHKKIHARLDSLGLAYIDLLDSYRNIPPERLQAIPGQDNHPNEIAHRIASTKIYEGLASKNLLPYDVRPSNYHSHRRLGSPYPRVKEAVSGVPANQAADDSSEHEDHD